MTDVEQWLPVVEWPGYEVSNRGQVRSLDREVEQMNRWGQLVTRRLKGKLLAQAKMGSSGSEGRYWGCTLFREGKRRPVTVHSLMLETFVGPRPEGALACHRDDNPDNNHLENLYWGTPTQNIQDAVQSGRHASVTEAAKECCPQGHEYTPENTYRRPRTGHRECRICHRQKARAAYHRKKDTLHKNPLV